MGFFHPTLGGLSDLRPLWHWGIFYKPPWEEVGWKDSRGVSGGSSCSSFAGVILPMSLYLGMATEEEDVGVKGEGGFFFQLHWPSPHFHQAQKDLSGHDMYGSGTVRT